LFQLEFVKLVRAGDPLGARRIRLRADLELVVVVVDSSAEGMTGKPHSQISCPEASPARTSDPAFSHLIVDDTEEHE
jgi:hypothetical protein